MDIAELSDSNPWWKDKNEINNVDKVKSWINSKVKWIPRCKHTFNFDKDVIYTIRGPRQVGKTTHVKLWIKSLLYNKGVDNKNIFYYSCDLVQNPKQLTNIIKTYLDWRMNNKNRKYIFLDEISSVLHWEKGIKFLSDNNEFKKCTVVLTGSHALDIQKSSERLPGRLGEEDIHDRLFLPMKFSEYVDTVHKKLKKTIRDLDLLKLNKRKDIVKQLLNGEICSELKTLNIYHKELKNLLNNYLINGGIARAIEYTIDDKDIPDNVYSDYYRVFIGDLRRYRKKENYVIQIFKRIINTLTSSISWRSIVKKTEIDSHTTGQDYVDTLKNTFTLSYIFRLNLNKGEPKYSSEKKIYFEDPFIFHSIRGHIFKGKNYFKNSENFILDYENKSKLIESIICDHLIRMAFNFYHPIEFFNYQNFLFYWKDKNNREVDFVIKTDDKYIPIEVKYRENDNGDYKGMNSFLRITKHKYGIVLTKNTLKIEKNLVKIPIYLFLLLI